MKLGVPRLFQKNSASRVSVDADNDYDFGYVIGRLATWMVLWLGCRVVGYS